MTIEYTPRELLLHTRVIGAQVEDGVIQSVQVIGGCDGNLKGISSLLKGMKVEDAIQRMEGIRCGGKPTSCPDQIARALRSALPQT
mgnify:CR=1 FL=1